MSRVLQFRSMYLGVFEGSLYEFDEQYARKIIGIIQIESLNNITDTSTKMLSKN